MKTTSQPGPLTDEALAQAMDGLWARFLPDIRDRVSVLEGAAQVGSNGANARELLRKGGPELTVHGRGVQENHREADSSLAESEPRIAYSIEVAHTPGGYARGNGEGSSGMPIHAAK